MVKEYGLPYYETCCGEDDEVLGPRHSTLSAANREGLKKLRAIPKVGLPKFLSDSDLNKGLNIILGRLDDPLAHKKILRDSIFPQITDLLSGYGKGEWSLRPRTFAILRMLGCPQALDEFIKLNRRDEFLPYTENNLPNVIKGSSNRSKFFKFQRMVLCNQQDISALEEGGKHLHLSSSGDTYFEHMQALGQGKFGAVDLVFSRQSLKQYARKLIHRGASELQDSHMCRQFESEIQAFKKLSHRHIVKLVGSYTDEKYLGLIMTPIAQMNLEEYLNCPRMDATIRIRCLRYFFGCLATALAYLHGRGVRHNDIKPRNVVIKDSAVFLTDFGTSKSWGTEDQSMTLGEQDRGFTKRYCAPEAFDSKGGRNRASDIWSMGCVFLEMATVLCNRTLSELEEFLEIHGSYSGYFWANPDGIIEWIKELRVTVPNGDGKVLDWTAAMLQRDPEERPTAGQLRGLIIDARAQENYICHDCALPDGTKPPSAPPVQRSKGPTKIDTAPRDSPDYFSVAENAPPVTASVLGRPERPAKSRSHSRPPQVSKQKKDPGVVTANTKSTEVRGEGKEAGPLAPISQKQPPPGASELQGVSVLGKQSAAVSKMPSRSDLEKKQSTLDSEKQASAIAEKQPASTSEKEVTLGLVDHTSPTLEKRAFPVIEEQPTSVSGKQVTLDSKEQPPTTTEDTSASDSSNSTSNSESDSESNSDPDSELDDGLEQVPIQRFDDLPADRRPAPLQAEDEAGDEEGDFVRPEPIRPPQFGQRESSLPKATLCPSYVLAGTNHFSSFELGSQPPTLSKNLFVCGRLMFPSVLRAIAAQSTKGIYSKELRRRLYPSSEDWSKADLSIRRASEIMTPARLQGFDRWKPSGLNCSVLQVSGLTKRILRERYRDGYDDLPSEQPGYVDGFLILGVRNEVLRYLDLLFASRRQTLHSLRPQDDTDGDEDEESEDSYMSQHLMQRETVEVQVETTTRELMSVAADTYVWSYGIDDLTNVWEEERFLRSSPMQALLRDQPSWAAEEQALASTMKISFAQVGDYLTAAILDGNLQDLAALLNNRFDANAACRGVYGFPLAAAVSSGREDMVQLLLERRANVNVSGGQYGTALIAACFGSRKIITKMLLHHGADVFHEDSVHVNALYQAVAHRDYTITEMLLEHGAWLSRNWGEIMDLAEELGDREVLCLLDRYDVRQIHRQHKRIKGSGDREEEVAAAADADEHEGSWELVSYSTIFMAVARKIATAQKMSGSWKGRRGMAVVVAALDAGAPLRLIGMLRGAVSPIKAILETLRKGDESREQMRQTHAPATLPAGDRDHQEREERGQTRRKVSTMRPAPSTRRSRGDRHERARLAPFVSWGGPDASEAPPPYRLEDEEPSGRRVRFGD